jgi:hypothetical protein
MPRFQLPVETPKTDVAKILYWLRFLIIYYDECDVDDQSDNLLDFGSTEAKPPISM